MRPSYTSGKWDVNPSSRDNVSINGIIKSSFSISPNPKPEHIISRKKMLYNPFTVYSTYRISINNYLHLDFPNYLQHISSHHAGQPKCNKQGYGQLQYLSRTFLQHQYYSGFIASLPISLILMKRLHHSLHLHQGLGQLSFQSWVMSKNQSH